MPTVYFWNINFAMKKLLTLFIFCICITAISQDLKRENIQGKIIVEGNDIENITIYNSSSNTGTVTDENGKFTIAVALKDIIEVRALEYQDFDIEINQAIIDSKTISIFLIEEINELEEVVIGKKALSGNLKTDIEIAGTFSPKRDILYFGIKNNDLQSANNGTNREIENAGMHSQGQTMVNGLNVVNIVDQLLIPLFRSEVKDKRAAGIPEVPAEAIKYYFGSTFLTDNFNIPEYRVEEFIRYVEADSFNFDLLNYGNEMEFLDLIYVKSIKFLNAENNTD